jgi:hypothetical protein
MKRDDATPPFQGNLNFTMSCIELLHYPIPISFSQHHSTNAVHLCRHLSDSLR